MQSFRQRAPTQTCPGYLSLSPVTQRTNSSPTGDQELITLRDSDLQPASDRALRQLSPLPIRKKGVFGQTGSTEPDRWAKPSFSWTPIPPEYKHEQTQRTLNTSFLRSPTLLRQSMSTSRQFRALWDVQVAWHQMLVRRAPRKNFGSQRRVAQVAAVSDEHATQRRSYVSWMCSVQHSEVQTQKKSKNEYQKRFKNINKKEKERTS